VSWGTSLPTSLDVGSLLRDCDDAGQGVRCRRICRIERCYLSVSAGRCHTSNCPVSHLRRGSLTTSDHQILCPRLELHSRRTSFGANRPAVVNALSSSGLAVSKSALDSITPSASEKPALTCSASPQKTIMRTSPELTRDCCRDTSCRGGIPSEAALRHRSFNRRIRSLMVVSARSCSGD